MAQTIKIKRGGIASLITTTPTLAQGELILATGSLNGLGSTFFVADAANAPELPYAKIESIANGATLASSLDGNFEGLLIHSASDNKLYRYNGTTFVELPVAAGSFDGILGVGSGGTGTASLGDGTVLIGNGTNAVETVTMTSGQFLIGNTSDNPSAVDASTIAGAGLTATTGPGTATLNVDSGSIAINDLDTTTQLSVANGGTNATSFVDKAVIISQDSGTDTLSGLALTTDGALVVGGSSAGPSVVTPATLGGNGITATGTDGSLVLSVDNLNDTINVAAGGISVNTGSISSGGTNLVNADVINSLSASIATDITANAGSVAGADTQVAFFDGNTSVTGDAEFTYNDSTNILTIDGSAFGADVTVAGNLTVQGTTTTVDSTIVNISSSIVRVNYGGAAVDGGLEVTDATGTGLATGSLLWDGSNSADWWKAGAKGSEKRIVTFDANSGGVETAIQKLDSDSNLVDSNITDDDSTVTINTIDFDVNGGDFSVTGAGSSTLTGAVLFTGLTVTDSANAADEVLFVQSDGTVGQIAASATTDEMVGILGYKSSGGMTFSTVIDGGTF